MDMFGLVFALVIFMIILLSLREPLRRFFFGSGWDYFVSYSSKDRETVNPIVARLRQRNYRVWIDSLAIDEQEAKAGRFRRPISVGIQKSAFALLFTSEKYCDSHFCREEADFFIQRFARQPDHIIEICLNQNDARNILGILSLCIDFKQFASAQDKEAQSISIADEIISKSGLRREETGSLQPKGLFDWLCDEKTQAFKAHKKKLIGQSQQWAIAQEKNFDVELESIVKPFLNEMRNEKIAPIIALIPEHTKTIAQKLLVYPPEVGAYLSIVAFGAFLIRNRLSQWPRGNLMLAFESMYAIDQQKVSQTAALIARALCMMDNKKMAASTYTTLTDSKMRLLVTEELLLINREVAGIIFETYTKKIESLIEIIKDKYGLWLNQQSAVDTLGNMREPRALQPIIDLIGTQLNQQVGTEHITQAIAKIGGEKAFEALILILQNGISYGCDCWNDESTDWEVHLNQSCAASALGELGDPRAVSPLMRILEDSKEYLVAHRPEVPLVDVIRALGKLGNSRAIGPLQDLLFNISINDNIPEKSKGYLQDEIHKALNSIKQANQS